MRKAMRPAVFGALALAVAAGGCGGGGSSGSSGAATSLAFTVAWEQPSAGASGVGTMSSLAGPLAFDTPIPASVNAIRFILRPDDGPACCIAVVRGSQAFIDRRILLSGVTAGESTLEVNGFPTDFAPSDGVANTCATSDGEGDDCEGDEDTLPSFGSDEISLDIVEGIRNVVDVDVHSLPFLLDLDPDDGETADSRRPTISFTVVDANFGIDPDIDVRIDADNLIVDAEIVSTEQCRDDDPELVDCSDDGELDVQGLIVTARPDVELPISLADLTIEASNTAAPPRSMVSQTTFIVPGDETTTTSTSSSTITTSTTITTTTLDSGLETFCLAFRVSNDVDLVGLAYTVSYSNTGGGFIGSGEDVECQLLLDTDPGTTLASFNDDDTESDQLFTAVISGDTFSGPTAVARCLFEQAPPLVLANFSIQVTEATAPDLSPANATVVVEETQCPL